MKEVRSYCEYIDLIYQMKILVRRWEEGEPSVVLRGEDGRAGKEEVQKMLNGNK